MLCLQQVAPTTYQQVGMGPAGAAGVAYPVGSMPVQQQLPGLPVLVSVPPGPPLVAGAPQVAHSGQMVQQALSYESGLSGGPGGMVARTSSSHSNVMGDMQQQAAGVGQTMLQAPAQVLPQAPAPAAPLAAVEPLLQAPGAPPVGAGGMMAMVPGPGMVAQVGVVLVTQHTVVCPLAACCLCA
jgi:hypothetical protein